MRESIICLFQCIIHHFLTADRTSLDLVILLIFSPSFFLLFFLLLLFVFLGFLVTTNFIMELLYSSFFSPLLISSSVFKDNSERDFPWYIRSPAAVAYLLLILLLSLAPISLSYARTCLQLFSICFYYYYFFD